MRVTQKYKTVTILAQYSRCELRECVSVRCFVTINIAYWLPQFAGLCEFCRLLLIAFEYSDISFTQFVQGKRITEH